MVSIVDIETKKVSQHKISVDSAIMHPKTGILVLRVGNLILIVNLELKSKVKEHNFNSENIVFMKWISVNKLAVVTEKAVYHWSIKENSTPELVFKRHENLTNGIIMNYRTDSSEQWVLLSTLVKSGSDTVGAMQLYSLERDVTQYIEGNAGCFIEFKISEKIVTLIAITSCSSQGGKIFILELPSKNQTGLFSKLSRQIQYSQDDFPVSMQVNEKLGILYILTRKGFLYLVDVESGTQLYVNRVSQESIFISAPHESTNGVIGVNNKVGQVLCISVDETKIIPFLKQSEMAELAIKIAKRGDIQDSSMSDLVLQQFNQLLNQQRFEDAVTLAVSSPDLRNIQTIQRFEKVISTSKQSVILLYFTKIIDNSKLNKVESIELAKIILQKVTGVDYIKHLLVQQKIEPVEELGDMVRQFDQDLAMKIYLEGKCHEKIIDTLMLTGDHERALAYCEKVNYVPNSNDILKKLSVVHQDSAGSKIELNNPIKMSHQGKWKVQITINSVEAKNTSSKSGYVTWKSGFKTGSTMSVKINQKQKFEFNQNFTFISKFGDSGSKKLKLKFIETNENGSKIQKSFGIVDLTPNMTIKREIELEKKKWLKNSKTGFILSYSISSVLVEKDGKEYYESLREVEYDGKEEVIKKEVEIKKEFENVIVEDKYYYEKEYFKLKDEYQNLKEKYEKDITQLKKDIYMNRVKVSDEDLIFEIPLKKRNCFYVKNVEKAKMLGGITSLKDLAKMIDNSEFTDLIEVKNLLDCLENVIEDYCNGILSLEELDQSFLERNKTIDQENFDKKVLIDIIYDHYEEPEFENLDISTKITERFVQNKKKMKQCELIDIYKLSISEIIEENTKTNLYTNDLKIFQKMIPFNEKEELEKIKKNLKCVEGYFRWEMIPEWKNRREKLIYHLSEKPFQKQSTFTGLLIE